MSLQILFYCSWEKLKDGNLIEFACYNCWGTLFKTISQRKGLSVLALIGHFGLSSQRGVHHEILILYAQTGNIHEEASSQEVFLVGVKVIKIDCPKEMPRTYLTRTTSEMTRLGEAIGHHGKLDPPRLTGSGRAGVWRGGTICRLHSCLN